MVRSGTDDSQTGRGRKRILYSVGRGVVSPIKFAIGKIVGQLQEISKTLESIEDAPNDKPSSLLKIIDDFKGEADAAFSSLSTLQSK